MTSQLVHPDILRVLTAVRVLSDTEYELNGIVRDIGKLRVFDPSRGVELTAGPDAADAGIERFRTILMTDIYNNLYSATFPSPVSPNLDPNDFIPSLSKANNGTGTFQEGWFLLGQEQRSSKLIVRKDGILYWVRPEDVVPRLPAGSEDQSCYVRIPKEARQMMPAFYMAFGNASRLDIPADCGPLLRFYFNLTPPAAELYLSEITRRLNQRRIHFRTKVIADPAGYNRSDAGVLYLRACQMAEALPEIMATHGVIDPLLKDGVPLFARRLAKGLAFAEDPGDGSSFGISRATLLAGALLDNPSPVETDQVAQSVYARFERSGLDSLRPYARQNNLAQYEAALASATSVWEKLT
ncbi:T3SS effector HopA1 family protein [Rhizobium rhizogenes]|uniref:T3SS effector HopA1 family protein n=1 Tax=Rhizobium rhizogenes TaxID=359 RepID=UPI002270E486|nr:T3SS effector HopA1 family protein [Rhizobium rhizogenes]